MEHATALVDHDATTPTITPAQRRAEARKLAQVRKLALTLARVEKAIAAGRTDFEGRAEQLREQIAGRLVGRCCRCHRTLTDPVSIAAGIGPECVTKVA
jgi:hypothetical protein